VAEQDIPFLDPSIERLPSDIREDLAATGRSSLFFFNKAVMGFRDLTEGCHGPLCEFADQNEKRYKLMLMPRDHLKTTIITIGGTMQRQVRNKEHRQLIRNETATNAEHFLGSIKQHAESNRVFRALYSDVIPKDTRKVPWNNEELVFNREGSYPEPSIKAVGMTSGATSQHYTHITYDDPISEEAVKSEKVMKDAITRMSTSLDLLVNQEKDTIWVVGTRWALWDVYSVWMETFGSQLGRFVRSVIENDALIWPERFTMEGIALKRKILGEYLFSCTQMNNPRNEQLQDLNVGDFRFWAEAGEDAVILFDQNGQQLDKWFYDQLDITTTVDLAPAETVNSDRNAVVTVGVSPKNQAIVLDAWGERCTPLKVIERLIYVYYRFRPRVFGIEEVNYQKAFKYFLQQAATEKGLYFNVVPVKPGGKHKTHIRGLQPLMATGRMYIHPTQHILRNEAADYPLGEHDDVLDALALHLQLFVGQMSTERWDKYKASERKLLRVLSGRTRDVGAPKDNRGLLLADPRKGILDIDDDEEDERPNASWTEVIVG
jgi:predicted phage terminase large subunit-like protein